VRLGKFMGHCNLVEHPPTSIFRTKHAKGKLLFLCVKPVVIGLEQLGSDVS
jgi:hypothetical protein